MEVQITYATGRIQFKKMENEFKDCARGNQWNQPGSTKTITEEDESYAKTTNGRPIAATSPKTQSLKYWAQFGTLKPTSLRSIW